MIEYGALIFIGLFLLWIIALVCLNLRVMLNKGKPKYIGVDMQGNMKDYTKWWLLNVNKGKEVNEQSVNPAIVDLVQMGDGLGGYRLSASTREETKANFRSAIKDMQEKWKETLPKHKTRVSLRNKRKRKEK